MVLDKETNIIQKNKKNPNWQCSRGLWTFKVLGIFGKQASKVLYSGNQTVKYSIWENQTKSLYKDHNTLDMSDHLKISCKTPEKISLQSHQSKHSLKLKVEYTSPFVSW